MSQQALEENGVPVDYVGGTSIGSFVGALVAAEERHSKIEPMVATWSKTLSHWWFYVQGKLILTSSFILWIKLTRLNSAYHLIL